MRKTLHDKLKGIVQYEFLSLKINSDVERIKKLKTKGWKVVIEYCGNVLMQK